MKRDDGFTVIEVLVSFVILALSLLTAYRTLGTAYGSAWRVALQDEALAVGQSQIARVGNDVPLRPDTFQGRLSRGATWSLAVEDITPSSGIRMFRRYAVTYKARDASGAPLFQLQTYRIARISGQ